MWKVIFKSGSTVIVVKAELNKDAATQMAIVLNTTLKFLRSNLRCAVVKYLKISK
jgi:hypothetical protein